LQELIDQRGLAMIDMGDNGDIAESLDTGHWNKKVGESGWRGL
jgi:hypothetical protein